MEVKTISSEWETIHQSREWGRYPSETVIRFVARNFYQMDRENVKILDFGCGQGAHTWYLSREGFDTYAFDGSQSAVDKAVQFLENEGLRAHLDVMDGANISYQDDYFDAVIDSACIGHNMIKDIKRMYSEIYRILKKEGKLFTTFFSTKTTGFGTGECLEHNTYKSVEAGPLQGVGVVHFWDKNEFSEIVKGAGFKNIEIENSIYTNNGNYIDSYVLTATKL